MFVLAEVCPLSTSLLKLVCIHCLQVCLSLGVSTVYSLFKLMHVHCLQVCLSTVSTVYRFFSAGLCQLSTSLFKLVCVHCLQVCLS